MLPGQEGSLKFSSLTAARGSGDFWCGKKKGHGEVKQWCKGLWSYNHIILSEKSILNSQNSVHGSYLFISLLIMHPSIYLSKNGTKLFVWGIQVCWAKSLPSETEGGGKWERHGGDREAKSEWAVINMLQSGCISEEHWEETTGHYSTTKGLLISLLGFNWG